MGVKKIKIGKTQLLYTTIFLYYFSIHLLKDRCNPNLTGLKGKTFKGKKIAKVVVKRHAFQFGHPVAIRKKDHLFDDIKLFLKTIR